MSLPQGEDCLFEPRRQITEEELHAYVDGALDRVRRLDVALYLAGSPIEAARVEAFRAQKEGIRALFDDVISEPLPKRLRKLMWRRPSLGVVCRCLPLFLAAAFACFLVVVETAVGQRLTLMHSTSMGAPARRPGGSGSVIRPPVLPPIARPGFDI